MCVKGPSLYNICVLFTLNYFFVNKISTSDYKRMSLNPSYKRKILLSTGTTCFGLSVEGFVRFLTRFVFVTYVHICSHLFVISTGYRHIAT